MRTPSSSLLVKSESFFTFSSFQCETESFFLSRLELTLVKMKAKISLESDRLGSESECEKQRKTSGIGMGVCRQAEGGGLNIFFRKNSLFLVFGETLVLCDAGVGE